MHAYILIHELHICVCVVSHFRHVRFRIPVDCNSPGSAVHGILQARILEWVAVPSTSVSSQHRDQTHTPCIEGKVLTTGPPEKSQNMCSLTFLKGSSFKREVQKAQIVSPSYQTIPRIQLCVFLTTTWTWNISLYFPNYRKHKEGKRHKHI